MAGHISGGDAAEHSGLLFGVALAGAMASLELGLWASDTLLFKPMRQELGRAWSVPVKTPRHG